MSDEPDTDVQGDAEPTDVRTGRRGFLATVFMGAGLLASHGVALAFAARYLYPVKTDRRQKLLVGLKSQMPPGSATSFRTPAGQTINIVHGASGFIALSDICPHLGCRVHWSQTDGKFICPCHDGHFDSSGQPISGPPKDENTPLSRFDVIVEGDRIFLDLPVQS